MNSRLSDSLATLRWPALLCCMLIAGSCRSPMPTETKSTGSPSNVTMGNIIPMPDSANPADAAFTLTANTRIEVEPGTVEITDIGHYLADKLRPASGYTLQVVSTSGPPASGNIYLTTVGGDPGLGDEGYRMTITQDLVTVVAFRPQGLFHGIQTVRQLLPSSIENPTMQPGPWVISAGTIRDSPRFSWRGAMLDVARHFYSVQDVKRYIDLIAYYKMNRFHFHLTDDQGWRIAIDSWPNLAAHGGSTQVGGGPGGYYTQAEYSDIVAYAQRRFIIVVPEVDMPGHTHAALASYPGLNKSGVAPPLYTGIGVGFSSLDMNKSVTYTFIDDVVREISALTPGPYFHIGGDEASSTDPAEYIRFVDSVQSIVQAHGKSVIGWEEIARGNLRTTSIAQHWANNTLPPMAVQQGAKIIMSPAGKTYLDMKYNAATVLGQDWAGLIEVMNAYSWDPATEVAGVSESSVLGLEAPLWTETLHTMADIEYMAFPRLVGYAEIGWSRPTGRNWTEYRIRLGSHGPRLTAMGVKFYPSPQVPWK